jgi:DNA-directed RNA polymerase specialized sigma24 family protein
MDVTHILHAIEQGDPSAAEQLLPLVYEELLRLAAQRLAHEKPGQTLDAELAVDSTGDDLFAVDEALARRAVAHPRAARLVQLRFFLGQTLVEAATHLGLRVRTAYRDWAYARAWLHRELDRGR